jgi:predicted RNA-binding Zn ribbon-like protein
VARTIGEAADGAVLAAALVNTRPRPASPDDALSDGAAVARLLAAHDLAVTPDEAAAALPALLRLRDELLAAFAAPDMPALAAALNPHLARAPGERLVADGSGWTLRPPDEDVPLADRVAFVAARGLAEVALAGPHRLGFCAADDCQAVYADASPRGARRYCTRTCASRVNVRRHRASHPDA